MADKITIAEIDIDMTASIAETKRLKEEVIELNKRTKELKETEGETSEEYIKSSAELKVLQKELRSQEQITQKVIETNNANTGSLDAMKAELSIVSKQWSALSEEERLNSERGKELTARKLELTEALKAEEKATGDTRRNVGNYAEGMREANESMAEFVPGANKVTESTKKVKKGFDLLSKHPIIAILVAIVAAFAALTASLKRSEEGQNTLIKVGAVLSSLWNTLLDVVTELAEKIVKAFEDPQQAVKDLWEAIKTNLVNRAIGLIDLFINLGEVITNTMKLAGQSIANVFRKNNKDLTEYKKAIAEASIDFGKAALQLTTGVEAEKLVDAFTNLGKEIAKDTAATLELKKAQIALKETIRDNLVLEAQDRLSLAKLKNEIDDKDKNNATERLRLIDQENNLLDSILARNLAIAKEKVRLQKLENDIHKSRAEDIETERQLEADVLNIQASIEAQKKEAIAKRIEAQRAAAQESVDLLQYELDVYLANNKEKEKDFARIAELERNVKLEELNNRLITENDYNLALIEIENKRIESIKQLKEESKQEELERLQIDYDNQLEILNNNILATLDLEKQGLEMKRKQEVEYAEKIGADIDKINQKYAKADKELEKAKVNAKLELAAGFANNISSIFGKNTAVSKAAAIAETTINTYKSATGAYSALAPVPVIGPVLGAAAAAAAVASGLENVRNILKVKSGLPGDTTSGGGISTPTNSIPQATTPQRNTVNPEIGAGIVSRNTSANGNNNISLQPTLVIDDVIAKQDQTLQQNKTQSV